MTRETKVGLIVAGSFLCLVCVVVASKLRPSDDPGKGASEEQTAPGAIAAVSPKQSTPPPEVKKKEESPKSAANEKKDGEVKPLQLIMPPKDATPISQPITFPPIEAEKDKDKNVAPPTLVLPSQPVVDDKKTVLVFPTEKPVEKPTLTMPPPEMPKDGPPTFPSLAAKEGPPTFPAITPKDGPPTFPSITPKEITPVNKAFNEKDPPGSTAKDGPPTFPTLPAAKDGPPTFPTLPKEAAVPIVPPLGQPMPLPGAELKQPPSITNPADAPKPVVGVMPPNPIPTIPSGDLPNTAKPDQFVKMKEPGAKPMPIIRDTEIHVCQPGDTNFAILSQKLYGTDKYAQALLRYNRDNYKATVNGSVFLSDTPNLLPGQQVHVAPVSILERDYLGVRPVSIGSIPTIPSTPPPLSKPMPLLPTQGTNQLPPSGGARTYTVQNPNGESILDIAERVLGDRGQWHKIWRVNPSYPPQNRIPAGTKLEIPAS
jgi:LysM domain